MSTDVTLNAGGGAGAQSSVVTGSATDNGNPLAPTFFFETSDAAVATVTALSKNSATVTAVADPTGPSTRTCTITGTVTDGVGVGHAATGIATVVTLADNITVTLDFAAPTP